MNDNNGFHTIIPVQTFDSDNIEDILNKFDELQKQNIISNSNFKDNKWLLHDEYSYVSLNFEINEKAYLEYYLAIFSINPDEFVSYMKTYAVMRIGDLALRTLQNLINDIRKMVQTPPDELMMAQDNYFTNPFRLSEFISLLPYDSLESDFLMDQIDCITDRHYAHSDSNQRSLATFDSYFLFNDIINDYWSSSELTQQERLFYYPLYLWWKITGVIPLRPREFILTPRKCLRKRKGKWYLRLRRNNLKGSNKKHAYKVKDDYYFCEYQIPDKLASEIKHYQDLSEKMGDSQLDTLFIPDIHYQKWERKKSHVNRYFTYVNLCTVLRYFFSEVVEGKYGLKVVDEREDRHLPEGCINYLYLGDTRHLALINIIAEGGTPVIAMMLAGHDHIDTASHYYSNITKLIDCKTYAQYRKVIQGSVQYAVSKPLNRSLITEKYTSLENGERCYSPSFMNNDFSDCVKAVGEYGEIGCCAVCTFHRNNTDYFHENSKYKENIERDCKYLERIIREVRIQKGNKEDILEACLKLHNSSYTYQKYLEEKEANNAKKTDN